MELNESIEHIGIITLMNVVSCGIVYGQECVDMDLDLVELEKIR